MKLSIIIPVLNEAEVIESCLQDLQCLRDKGHEVIVADGGSIDATVELARPLADKIVKCPKGRAIQMNTGARVAKGDIFIFLHVDTQFLCDVGELFGNESGDDAVWGRFDVKLSGRHPLFRLIEFFMNLRSRLTGIATGDQAMFVARDLFTKAGAFPAIPLMEDVELSKILKRHCSPLCINEKVLTSSRRWEERGIVKTIILMLVFRLRYALGINPAELARKYD